MLNLMGILIYDNELSKQILEASDKNNNDNDVITKGNMSTLNGIGIPSFLYFWDGMLIFFSFW